MTERQEGALSGYRVLDLADSKGAYCTKLLADMGAEVIKIESPEGDPGRQMPPFVDDKPHLEKSLYFLHRNAGKHGITLDLKSTEGKSVFKKLVKTADILVDNSPPDHMKNLGLDYSVLKKINPGLIMAGITEFGQDGPYKNYKGSNLVDFAMSGVLITSGFPGKPPCLIPGTQAHDSASMIAAIGILSALYMRSATGQGQYIDTSVHESSRVCLYPWILPTYTHGLSEGVPAGVETRRGDSIYPVYPCKDGLIRLIALTPRQWDAMIRVLDNPEVLLLPDWRNFIYRIINADALYPLIVDFTQKYTMQELFEAGHREGVPIAPICSIEDFIKSPHTKERKVFVEIDHPEAGKALYPGPPHKWSKTPACVHIPAPCLGQHNDKIYGKEIDLSKDDLTTSKSANAVEEKKRTPLEGITVLGFETGAAGPDLTKILGELGADVIKLESSQNLDFMRCIGSDINKIGGFNESNRNKQSFGLNLSKKKGKKIASELIKMTDILVENFRGGVMENLGFDYDTVKQINPEIIYLSSQGFGSGGPYSDYQAYGPIVAAASGMLSVWADPDDPYPVGSNSPIPDHTASKHLVIAVLAALDYKRRTGKGQLIDMAQTDVAVSLMGEYFLDYTYNHRIPKPTGNKNPYAAPHNCYPCQEEDEWCAITIFTNEEWQGFCEAIGNPLWTKDPKFADIPNRVKNVEELDSQIEEWTKARSAKEIMESLQAKGVAAGIVQRSTDTLEDPQLKWLDAITELDHPVAGKTLYPAIPFRMSGTSPLTSRPAPLLGQHTKEICKERLNMKDDEINKLINEDILHTPESTEGKVEGMFG